MARRFAMNKRVSLDYTLVWILAGAVFSPTGLIVHPLLPGNPNTDHESDST